VALFKHFSLLVPKDWQKIPTTEHPEQVERRSDDPENWIVRKWIELADAALRSEDHEGGASLG